MDFVSVDYAFKSFSVHIKNMRDEWIEKKFGLPNSDSLAEILDKAVKNSVFNEIGGIYLILNMHYMKKKGMLPLSWK